MSDNKKRFIIFLVFGIILSVVVPATVVILQTLFINKFNISIVTVDFVKSIIFSMATYKAFFNFKVDNPFEILGYAVFVFFIVSYLLKLVTSFSPKKEYEQKEEYGSHGSSRWQTNKEITKNYYDDKLGWFLGCKEKGTKYSIGMDAAYLKVNGVLNMQTVVIGPPGSNKTTGFVLPNIFHLPDIYKKVGNGEMPDIILTDPKSELFCLTSNYLEKKGYDVKVLDFINLKYGDSINPLEFIEDDKTLMEICRGYIDSVESSRTSGESGGDQAFWNAQEAQLLCALSGYVKEVYPKEEQTLTSVAKLLASPQVNDEFECRKLFEGKNIKGATLQMWNNFLAFAENEKTKSNIVGGLAEKMVLFSIEGIQRITQNTTIDLTMLGMKKNKPIALFILMPDQDKTFSPTINVIISILFKQLYKNAYKCHNKLENPVYLILEEMANIGKLPNMKEMLGTMRGRRIYPMMIWQSLAQMKERYKDAYEDILSMCDTKVYLGINDNFTAKYCSDTLGDTTIQVQNISKKGDQGILINDSSENKSYSSRKLMMPDETRRLPKDKLIIEQGGLFPCQLYKTQYRYWDKKFCEEVTVDSLIELPSIVSSDFNTSIDIDYVKVKEAKNRSENIEKFEERNKVEQLVEEENIFDKEIEFNID